MRPPTPPDHSGMDGNESNRERVRKVARKLVYKVRKEMYERQKRFSLRSTQFRILHCILAALLCFLRMYQLVMDNEKLEEIDDLTSGFFFLCISSIALLAFKAYENMDSVLTDMIFMYDVAIAFISVSLHYGYIHDIAGKSFTYTFFFVPIDFILILYFTTKMMQLFFMIIRFEYNCINQFMAKRYDWFKKEFTDDFDQLFDHELNEYKHNVMGIPRVKILVPDVPTNNRMNYYKPKQIQKLAEMARDKVDSKKSEGIHSTSNTTNESDNTGESDATLKDEPSGKSTSATTEATKINSNQKPTSNQNEKSSVNTNEKSDQTSERSNLKLRLIEDSKRLRNAIIICDASILILRVIFMAFINLRSQDSLCITFGILLVLTCNLMKLFFPELEFEGTLLEKNIIYCFDFMIHVSSLCGIHYIYYISKELENFAGKITAIFLLISSLLKMFKSFHNLWFKDHILIHTYMAFKAFKASRAEESTVDSSPIRDAKRYKTLGQEIIGKVVNAVNRPEIFVQPSKVDEDNKVHLHCLFALVHRSINLALMCLYLLMRSTEYNAMGENITTLLFQNTLLLFLFFTSMYFFQNFDWNVRSKKKLSFFDAITFFVALWLMLALLNQGKSQLNQPFFQLKQILLMFFLISQGTFIGVAVGLQNLESSLKNWQEAKNKIAHSEIDSPHCNKPQSNNEAEILLENKKKIVKPPAELTSGLSNDEDKYSGAILKKDISQSVFNAFPILLDNAFKNQGINLSKKNADSQAIIRVNIKSIVDMPKKIANALKKSADDCVDGIGMSCIRKNRLNITVQDAMVEIDLNSTSEESENDNINANGVDLNDPDIKRKRESVFNLESKRCRISSRSDQPKLEITIPPKTDFCKEKVSAFEPDPPVNGILENGAYQNGKNQNGHQKHDHNQVNGVVAINGIHKPGEEAINGLSDNWLTGQLTESTFSNDSLATVVPRSRDPSPTIEQLLNEAVEVKETNANEQIKENEAIKTNGTSVELIENITPDATEESMCGEKNLVNGASKVIDRSESNIKNAKEVNEDSEPTNNENAEKENEAIEPTVSNDNDVSKDTDGNEESINSEDPDENALPKVSVNVDVEYNEGSNQTSKENKSKPNQYSKKKKKNYKK